VFQSSAGLRFEHHTYGDPMRLIGYSCQVLGAENRFAVRPVWRILRNGRLTCFEVVTWNIASVIADDTHLLWLCQFKSPPKFSQVTSL
jgi:hypothetical protein